MKKNSHKEICKVLYEKSLSFLEENIFLVLILLLFLVSQLLFSNSELVNFEYIFAQAAHRIAETGLFSADLGFYVSGMANPLLTSIIAAPFIALFGFIPIVMHLPFIMLSTVFLLVFYVMIKRIFQKNIALISTLLITFNPLFWNYSGMIYSDVLCMILVTFSIFLFYYGLKSGQKKYFIISALLLCFSFLAKYVAAIFFVFVFIFLFMLHYNKTKKKKSKNLWPKVIFFTKSLISDYWSYPVFFMLICLSYVIWTVIKYGFLLSPKHVSVSFWSMDTFFMNYIISFLGYVMWIALFGGVLGIFSLQSLNKKIKKNAHKFFLIISLVIVDILVMKFIYHPVGELDFGFLDSLLPGVLGFAVRLSALFIGEIILLDFLMKRETSTLIDRLLRWWLFFSLFALSIARPTQRYLLLLLPPLVLYYARTVSKKSIKVFFRNFAVALTMILFFIMCVILLVYKANLGAASAGIIGYINENDLVAGLDAEPGIHSYHLLNNQTYYPVDDYSMVAGNYSRPYYAGRSNSINRSKYDIIFKLPVEIFGLNIKELVVAEKIC